jgi:hypothetical protein
MSSWRCKASSSCVAGSRALVVLEHLLLTLIIIIIIIDHHHHQITKLSHSINADADVGAASTI